jgi:hypothetical protein
MDEDSPWKTYAQIQRVAGSYRLSDLVAELIQHSHVSLMRLRVAM